MFLGLRWGPGRPVLGQVDPNVLGGSELWGSIAVVYHQPSEQKLPGPWLLRATIPAGPQEAVRATRGSHLPPVLELALECAAQNFRAQCKYSEGPWLGFHVHRTPVSRSATRRCCGMELAPDSAL